MRAIYLELNYARVSSPPSRAAACGKKYVSINKAAVHLAPPTAELSKFSLLASCARLVLVKLQNTKPLSKFLSVIEVLAYIFTIITPVLKGFFAKTDQNGYFTSIMSH